MCVCVYAHGFVWLLANHRTHFHKPSWCEANQIYLLNAQRKKNNQKSSTVTFSLSCNIMYGKLNADEIKRNKGSHNTYSDKFILRLISPVTELVRSIWAPEINLIVGRDSAEIT